MSKYKSSTITNELKKEVPDLFFEIGINLYKEGFAAAPPHPKKTEKNGKLWFESKKSEIRKLICKNEKVMKVFKENKNDNKIEIITIIADCISNIVIGTTIPIITLSVLIFKEGINNLCYECKK